MEYPCSGFEEGVKKALNVNNESEILTTDEEQNIEGAKTFAVDSLLLKSSTTDSTKVFKITVVDAGTLTATEVE